jgi:hypothetical protein
MMVGKRVLDHLEAARAKIVEESRGIAYPGHRMHRSTAKGLEWLRLPRASHLLRPPGNEPHP